MGAKRYLRKITLKKPRARKTREITQFRDQVWDYFDGSGIGESAESAQQGATIVERRLAMARAEGFVVVEDVTQDAAPAPKPKRGIDALKAELDELLAEWADDGYDNLKDAILDARNALAKAKKLPAYRPRIEKMLRAATKQLVELALEDPTMLSYARGLVDPAYVSAAQWRRFSRTH